MVLSLSWRQNRPQGGLNVVDLIATKRWTGALCSWPPATPVAPRSQSSSKIRSSVTTLPVRAHRYIERLAVVESVAQTFPFLWLAWALVVRPLAWVRFWIIRALDTYCCVSGYAVNCPESGATPLLVRPTHSKLTRANTSLTLFCCMAQGKLSPKTWWHQSDTCRIKASRVRLPRFMLTLLFCRRIRWSHLQHRLFGNQQHSIFRKLGVGRRVGNNERRARPRTVEFNVSWQHAELLPGRVQRFWWRETCTLDYYVSLKMWTNATLYMKWETTPLQLHGCCSQGRCVKELAWLYCFHLFKTTN